MARGTFFFNVLVNLILVEPWQQLASRYSLAPCVFFWWNFLPRSGDVLHFWWNSLPRSGGFSHFWWASFPRSGGFLRFGEISLPGRVA